RARVPQRDRPRAGRGLAPCAAGIAEDAHAQPGKVDEITVLQRMAGALEPAQPVLGIGRVAGLAHPAVVDDVDAGFRLLAHDLVHGGTDAGSERRAVDGHALLLGEHRPDEVVRSGQAAGVRRQKPLGALLHRMLPSCARDEPRKPRTNIYYMSAETS